MPAWRLDNQDRHVARYDVGASDGDQSSFIGHVLLCDVDAQVVNTQSSTIHAVHMGPPLKQSPARLHAVGTVEFDAFPIGRGERRQIKSFLEERLLEQRAQAERLKKVGQRPHPKDEYIIHPAAKGPSPDYPLWRFNCSGFVLHAYLEANIELVAQGQVPSIAIGALKEAYPNFARRLDDADFRKEMGIGDGDEWPVLLAGYIVNSLNRTAAEIRQTPYAPQLGDRYFPPRAL